MKVINITIPYRLPSVSNLREHWAKRNDRVRKEKIIVESYLKQAKIIPSSFIPKEIILVRIAPRQLDSDNLQTAFKSIRDTVAGFFYPEKKRGRADDDNSISWHYRQLKGKPKEYAIQIVLHLC